jgi:hypothetical protein
VFRLRTSNDYSEAIPKTHKRSKTCFDILLSLIDSFKTLTFQSVTNFGLGYIEDRLVDEAIEKWVEAMILGTR